MNLLFVDDDVLLLNDLKQKLDWHAWGFDKVYAAQNAQSALNIVQQLPIHIIVCDIEMPQGSGLDFLARLRSLNITTPCILLTSYARFEYAQAALRLQIVDYLLKPVSTQALEDALKKALNSLDQAHRFRSARKYSEYWLDERRNIAEFFWLNAARETFSGLEALAGKLEYEPDRLFVPALVECFQKQKSLCWDAPCWNTRLKTLGTSC